MSAMNRRDHRSFSSDVRDNNSNGEVTRMPSTGAGAPTGAGAESQPIIH